MNPDPKKPFEVGTGLSEDARARILSRLGSEGPRVVQRSRIRRTVIRTTLPMLVVFGGVALLRSQTSKPKPSNTPIIAQAPTQRACEAFKAIEKAKFQKIEDQYILKLSDRAYAVASEDARVHLVKATGCQTTIKLDFGEVTVHAKDLGGGQLLVETDLGRVEVLGTVFSVEKRKHVRIEVAKGKVRFRSRRGKKAEIKKRGRLLVSSETPRREEVSDLRVEELLKKVGLHKEPVVEADNSMTLPEPMQKNRSSRPARRTKRKRVAAKARKRPAVSVPSEEASPTMSATHWVEQAELARDQGALDRARKYYLRAAEGGDATAEGAWVALAKLELGRGRPKAALSALQLRREQFGEGVLGPESTWLTLVAQKKLGRTGGAQKTALRLIQRWPNSEQATAASAWLKTLED